MDERDPVPVGLLTLGLVSIVLVVVVVLVVLQLTGASPSFPVPTDVQRASTALVQELTSVPASAFDAVGDPSAPLLSTPSVLTGKPPLSIGKLPAVLWVGALYCPACAAERWALVIALGRFGTFDKLFTTALGWFGGLACHPDVQLRRLGLRQQHGAALLGRGVRQPAV